MSTALTTAQAHELREREARLEKNLNAAYEDLAAIRDKKLYIATHDSFEAYCKDRWNISRRQAYRLIEVAQVVRNLCPNGTHSLPRLPNERQARELAKASPEKQSEVWKKATADGKPTAAKVKATVAELDDFDPETIEATTSGPNLKALAEPYKLAGRDLDRIRRDMQALADDPTVGGYLSDKITRITTSCRELKATISQMEPTEVCGKCHGKTCRWCAGTGFWTKAIVQSRKQ